MKLWKIIFLISAFLISSQAANLRGFTGTDIDNYAVQFNQKTIDTCRALYAKWLLNPGWNKYRVTTLGNSITFSYDHWEGFDRPIQANAHAAQINAFKDSTFAANHWCSPDSCKGPENGNQSSKVIANVVVWVCTDSVIKKHKSMVAPIMIGTNDINTPASGPPRMGIYKIALNCIVSSGTIPIITTLPPINKDASSWTQAFDPDSLLVPFNDSLRMEAEKRGLPLLDLHRWCMDHGGPGVLNSDWTHPKPCGSWGIDFSDDCLDGGVSGGTNNARNYLLMLAMHDIMKYVVKGEPLTAVEKDRGLVNGIDISISPNPFNPSTVITVRGIEASQALVRVAIYGTNGKLIQPLHGSRTYGRYSFLCNSLGMPPGIYFVVVKTLGNQYCRKIIVQK